MTEPKAYLNGHWFPPREAGLPVSDGGFVQGTTVAEQLRTFGGQLFRLEAHVDRLLRSLAIVEFDAGLTARELCDIAAELADTNHALLAPGDDLGLSMFVTPGPYPAMADAPRGRFDGLHAHVSPSLRPVGRQVSHRRNRWPRPTWRRCPRNCWPPELKCRSRMHYYLADRQARFRYPGSRALMLDEDGFVIEATTANIVLYEADRGLVTPPAAQDPARYQHGGARGPG